MSPHFIRFREDSVRASEGVKESVQRKTASRLNLKAVGTAFNWGFGA